METGASRSIKNRYGCLPNEKTENAQTKEIFRRIQGNNRFVGSSGKIEWVLVTPHVREMAAAERHTLEFYRNRKIEELADRVKHYYLAIQLKDMTGLDLVMSYFEKAIEKKNPEFIIRAYTAETGFYSRLNCDLAGGAETGKYERQFLVGIIMYHPALDQYTYLGEAHRGMKITDEDLQHYTIGSSIMTKSFLSTSEERETAEHFAQRPTAGESQSTSASKVLAVCTYMIKNKRTALTVAKMSEYPDEKEVLIMPYAAFMVKDIDKTYRNKHGINFVNIALEECDLFERKC